MTSTGSGSRPSGSAASRSADRRADGERAQRRAEPVGAQPGGVQPACEVAQLRARDPRLLAGEPHQPRALARVALGLAEREVEALAEHDQALLGAVVEVAADPAALLVGGVQQPGARGGDLDLARAQDRLVAPALELGRRAGGEDAQHGALLVARVEAGAGEHADVADERAGRVAHRHREVALEPVPGEEAVAREARRRCRSGG